MNLRLIKSSILLLPRSAKRFLALFVDMCICYFSVCLAFYLRSDLLDIFSFDHSIAFGIACIIFIPVFIRFGLYRAIFRYVGMGALLSVFKAFLIYGLIFFCVIGLIGIQNIPRSISVSQPILFLLGVSFSRFLARKWLSEADQSRLHFKTTQSIAIIYGAGLAGRQLASSLFVNSQNIKVVGFIDDDIKLHGLFLNNIKIYSKEVIPSLIIKLGITDILLAIPSASQNRKNEIISSFEGLGVRVRKIPELNFINTGLANISQLHELDMNELLGRDALAVNEIASNEEFFKKTILITGAGGSIGSELCRQVIAFAPATLVLVDNSEHNLYLISEEIQKAILHSRKQFSDVDSIEVSDDHLGASGVKVIPCLVSIQDPSELRNLFDLYRPDVVFHAAAYKHVPLVEINLVQAIQNNIFGTLNCALISKEYNVGKFILVSTDKAVRPTSVMGTTKRISELILQALNDIKAHDASVTKFSMVRFGNVLGSSGSVAPLFRSQINSGGPITLTHREVTRYFMTIPEAAQLVIRACKMACGGEVFVLDMGPPIRIFDLAVKMIHLSGLIVKDKLHPHGDIEIRVTGLRPGEKLYEELLIGDNPETTSHQKIMKANEQFLTWHELLPELDNLKQAAKSMNNTAAHSILRRLVPDYQSSQAS